MIKLKYFSIVAPKRVIFTNSNAFIGFLETVNENVNLEYARDDYGRLERGIQEGGCSAVFMGEMMYFGGTPNTKQYSIIRKHCQVERQFTEMPFDYFRGACNSFMEPTPKVLLCFNYYNDIGFGNPDMSYDYGRECHT